MGKNNDDAIEPVFLARRHDRRLAGKSGSGMFMNPVLPCSY